MRPSALTRERATLAEREVDRLRLAIIAVGTLYLPWLWMDPRSWPWLATGLLVAGWIYSLVLLLRPGRHAVARGTRVTAAADALLTLAWILGTGGTQSPFFSLVVVTAVAAAIRFPPRSAGWIAGGYALGYLAVILLRGQTASLGMDVVPRLGVLLVGTYLGSRISYVTLRQALARNALARRRKELEARGFLLAVLEASQDAVVGLDPEGRIVSWSRGAERITGYGAAEVQGRHAESLFEPEHRPVVDYYLEIARTKSEVPRFELPLLTREGARRVLSISSAPVRGDDGELRGVSVIARDVTERVENERQLRRSRRQLEEAQRLAHLGSWEWNFESDAISWSPELFRIVGADPHAFQPDYGRWSEVVHPDDVPMMSAALTRVLADPTPLDFEHRIRRPSGEVRWVRNRAETERDASGKVVLIRGTTQDITEHRRAIDARLRLMEERAARAAAEEALRARDEFLSVAAHELKTPITSLKLHVQGLIRSASGNSAELGAIRDRLERVDRQTVHLNHLIEGLLDVSRVAQGRMELQLQPTDLKRVAQASVERFAEQATRTGTPLEFVGGPSVVGQWDPLRLSQVVDNLLSNALKYGAGKPVQVEIEQVAGAARLIVRDRGISIAAEDQQRIFERFERAVPTRHFGGLGLGLWLVREVVAAMGGEVTVESSPGEGSTFTITLPLRPGLRTVAEASSPH